MSATIPRGSVRMLLTKNDLTAGFNPENADTVIQAAENLLRTIKDAAALKQSVEDGKGVEEVSLALESLGEAWLALLMVPALYGVDPQLFFSITLQSEIDGQKPKYAGMAQAALLTKYGTSYNEKLGLHPLRGD